MKEQNIVRKSKNFPDKARKSQHFHFTTNVRKTRQFYLFEQVSGLSGQCLDYPD